MDNKGNVLSTSLEGNKGSGSMTLLVNNLGTICR